MVGSLGNIYKIKIFFLAYYVEVVDLLKSLFNSPTNYMFNIFAVSGNRLRDVVIWFVKL